MRAETIIGLDASLTHMGIAFLSTGSGAYIAGRTYSSKKKGVERLNDINQWLLKVIIEHKGKDNNAIAVMEGYAYNPRAGQQFSLGELGGTIKLLLFNLGIPCVVIAPTTLKKWITGSGKGDKNMILLKAYQKYMIEFSDDHQCDAYGLAMLGKALIDIENKTKDIKGYFQYEQEVLKLIKKQL